MRHLSVPVCLALLTWGSSIGPEPSLAKLPDTAALAATSEADIAIAPTPAVHAQERADAAAIVASTGYADQYEIPDPVGEPIPAYLKPLRPIVKPIIPRTRAEICDTITNVAHSNNLPAPFFIRLLFQESGFRPGTISPAGAEGVAQFMPETAADRGLDNPFDPVQAIAASASLLRDLARRFGNLGLAAAAYNAGPKRVADWLARKTKLPQETKAYVKTITGRPAQNWTAAEHGSPAIKLQRRAPCQEAAGLLAWDGPDHIPLPPTRDAAHKTARPGAKGDATLAKRLHENHGRQFAAKTRTVKTLAKEAVAAHAAAKHGEKHGAKLTAKSKRHRLRVSQR